MQSTRSAGFTMLEIIVVLVIIGVLSMVASGVMSGTDFAREAGESEQMRMDLRYAQQLAMGSVKDVPVKLNAASNAYALPSGMKFVTGKDTVMLKSNIRADLDIIFSAQTGLPQSDAICEIGSDHVVRIYKLTGLIE